MNLMPTRGAFTRINIDRQRESWGWILQSRNVVNRYGDYVVPATS
jgi:hypothetical protein